MGVGENVIVSNSALGGPALVADVAHLGYGNLEIQTGRSYAPLHLEASNDIYHPWLCL
jgi:hypothetical protein